MWKSSGSEQGASSKEILRMDFVGNTSEKNRIGIPLNIEDPRSVREEDPYGIDWNGTKVRPVVTRMVQNRNPSPNN